MLGLRRNRRGDTIIEVMVALAILGLAFAISYATANHALQVSQNSQEHSQALQYLDSQVELVRADTKDTNLYTSSPFCMVASTAKPTTNLSAADCTPTSGGANYKISVKYTPATNADGVNQDIFTFTITWQGLGDLGQQHERIAYKLHDTTDFASGGSIGSGAVPPPVCPVGEIGTPPNCVTPASIRVAVNKIVPDAGNQTPSCTKAATGDVAGSTVKLLTNGGPTQVTGANSSTVFNGLTDGKNYTVEVTSGPPRYEVCAPDTASAMASDISPPIIRFKVRPLCYVSSYNNYYQITGRDSTFDGWWRFGNTTPSEAYTQSLTEYWGQTYTKTYPDYWYFKGINSYYTSGGYTYRYYYVYDAVWHSDPVYNCPS